MITTSALNSYLYKITVIFYKATATSTVGMVGILTSIALVIENIFDINSRMISHIKNQEIVIIRYKNAFILD